MSGCKVSFFLLLVVTLLVDTLLFGYHFNVASRMTKTLEVARRAEKTNISLFEFPTVDDVIVKTQLIRFSKHPLFSYKTSDLEIALQCM